MLPSAERKTVTCLFNKCLTPNNSCSKLKTAHIELVSPKDYLKHMYLIVNTQIMAVKFFFI